ncbi:hypothetical protein D3C71_1602930 [compost metagenome]
MVNALEAAADRHLRVQIEVRAINIGVLIHQIDQAAIRRTHRRQLQLVGADQPAIGLALVGYSTGQCTGAVLDPHGRSAQRRAVGFEKAMAE